mgnify:FL=1
MLDARCDSLTLTKPLADVSWIRETEPACTVVCPECLTQHEEEPIARPGPGGTVRLYIPCPELLRVQIDPSELDRWSVDISALAEAIARSLGLAGRVKDLRAGRLWRLGRTRWRQLSRDVLFARGLHWPSADDVIAQAERTTHPIVLVPDKIPVGRAWRRQVAVVAMSHVSQLSHDGLIIDHTHLFAAVADQQQQPAEPAAEIISGKKQKLMIRRQVKAEIGSMLEDDALVVAYAQHGSYRAAAEALSVQTGRTVTKDKVYRAVQRRGGARTVQSDTNSHSVRRTVASQRRNKTKSIQNRPTAADRDFDRPDD